jgi:hypothetical protein
MVSVTLSAHLRIKELEGRIGARRQLAERTPEHTWHLDYVKAYEAEMQDLRSALRSANSASTRAMSQVEAQPLR